MLILSRKAGESINCTTPDGRTITVSLIQAHGPVTVGIKAPRDVKVLRDELSRSATPLVAQDEHLRTGSASRALEVKQ